MAENELNPSEEIQEEEVLAPQDAEAAEDVEVQDADAAEDVEVAEEAEAAEGEEEKKQLTLDIKVEERSSCERHITVAISRADVDEFMSKEFDKLMPDAQVPGFRKGRAPRKLVENRFRKDVSERIKGALLTESISQVDETKKLVPISDPEFDYSAIEIPDEGDFVFEYDLEVRPDFEVPNWRGMTIKKPVREFTDKDLEDASEAFRSRYGKLTETEPETEAVSGDFIQTSLFIRYNDEIINQSDCETIRLRPTLYFTDATLENFDAQMAGVKAGETRTLKLKLSDQAPNILLRGKEVDAVFEVKSISRQTLPEVNEEWLDRFDWSDVEEYNSYLRLRLKYQMERQQQEVARECITEQLLADAEWDLPEKLLDRQAERELYRRILDYQRSGFSEEMIRENINILRQNIREATKGFLREHFILEKIAEMEKIEVTEEDYDEEIANIAMRSGDSPRRVRNRLEKSNQMDLLRNQIIEGKVVNLILESAQFEETTFEMEPSEMASLDFTAGGEGGDEVEPEAVTTEQEAAAETEA